MFPTRDKIKCLADRYVCPADSDTIFMAAFQFSVDMVVLSPCSENIGSCTIDPLAVSLL